MYSFRIENVILGGAKIITFVLVKLAGRCTVNVMIALTASQNFFGLGTYLVVLKLFGLPVQLGSVEGRTMLLIASCSVLLFSTDGLTTSPSGIHGRCRFGGT